MSLLALLEPFRFIKHARERREAQLREERDHQRVLLGTLITGLETILDSMAAQSKENAGAMIAVAQSTAVQAQSFSKWLDCFRITEPPTTSVVRDEDEVAAEEERFGAGFADLPEEFKLALALTRDVAADNTP